MTEAEVPARKQIEIGQRVWAIEKRNYGTDDLTEGVVKRILTSKPVHPRGIKVMFEDGTVARVQRLSAPPPKPEITQSDIPTEEDLI
ncbi:MAG: YwbE family protein [Patescibacteria group bacterium]